MSKTAKRMKAMWALKAAKAAAAFELLLDESMFGKLAEACKKKGIAITAC